MPASYSIIIPTSGKISWVKRLVESLRPEMESSDVHLEVIILDNGKVNTPSPDLIEMAGSLGGHGRYLHYPIGGKSCALNFAIPQAQGEVLLFLDDDMRIERGWLEGAKSFFAETDYDLMQGRVLPEPEEDLSRYEYPMVPTCDKGDERRAFKGLGGGNVGGYASWYRRFPFDERLGVGASGAGEDSQFYHAVSDAGAKVGYEPKALVYHPLIPERATQRHFQRGHYLSGKSSCTYRKFRMIHVLWNILFHSLAYLFTRLFHLSRKRVQGHEAALYRNLGRWVGLIEKALGG